MYVRIQNKPILAIALAALCLFLALALSPLIGGGAANASRNFPDVIPLPDGFQPEGIGIAEPYRFFAGSLAAGAIYAGDLRTGSGSILVPPQDGRVAVGLNHDPRTDDLYVAGGGTGEGYVYDASTGDTIAVLSLTSPGTFVNDVIVTPDAAYFTDSFRPVLYRVPLEPGGDLPAPPTVEEIDLTGDFDFVPGEFNANGIEYADRADALVLVNSFLGTLYNVDPDSGEALLIDLAGGNVASGDGILLDDSTLYVVQNFLNQIAVVDLDPRMTSGEVVSVITDSNFRIPTTVADTGLSLYAVNARFDVQPGPDVEYEIVRVLKPILQIGR